MIAVDIDMALQGFLREAASRRFRPGTDCAMLIADWVWLLTGFDPATAIRGTYRSEAEWRRIVADAGGLAALVGELAVAAGLTPVAPATARRGDIGVVSASEGDTCAIRTGRAWAMAGARSGVTIYDWPARAAWRVI